MARTQIPLFYWLLVIGYWLLSSIIASPATILNYNLPLNLLKYEHRSTLICVLSAQISNFQMAKKIEVNINSPRDIPLAVVKQMITLSTSGFGLVAALAWNELVKEFIESYVKPYLPQGSKLISLFIYAAIVTSLAVSITLQLTKIEKRLEKTLEREKPVKNKKPKNSTKE